MHKKVKVLYTLETISSGGVEKLRLSVIRQLLKQNFTFKIICTNFDDNVFTREFIALGIEIIDLKKTVHPFDFQTILKVKNIIQQFDPDIIHGGVFEGCTMAAISGTLARVPIRILEETSDPANRSSKATILLKLYSLLADKFIAISPSVHQYLTTQAKVKKEKTILINNGVKVPRSYSNIEKQTLRENLGIKSDDIVIGSVGRMFDDSHKRFSYLIKAFSDLHKKNSHLKLLLLGEGKEQNNYKLLAKELGVYNQVIFAGFQADPYPYFQIMDVFSLVSDREGFGLVVAEAMLSKLPVVATAVGGMKDIVQPKITGTLVERGNIKEIAAALETMVADEELRLKYGRNGYAHAIKEYSEDVYVSKIQDLYHELLFTQKKLK